MQIKAAKDILLLIEQADKEDLNAIINIEGAVWSLFNPMKGMTFLKAVRSTNYNSMEAVVFTKDDGETTRLYPSVLEYARSLDAIKALMLPEWKVLLVQFDVGNFTASVDVSNHELFEAGNAPTMELAWLHAVIQAHIWEWDNA